MKRQRGKGKPNSSDGEDPDSVKVIKFGSKRLIKNQIIIVANNAAILDPIC